MKVKCEDADNHYVCLDGCEHVEEHEEKEECTWDCGLYGYTKCIPVERKKNE